MTTAQRILQIEAKLASLKADLAKEAPTMERQKSVKDWEIEEFKATYRHGFPGDTAKVSEAINKEHWMEHYLDSMKRGAHEIHSVRRLSDKTVWTVGDKTNRGVIDRFMISDGTLFVFGNDWNTLLRTIVKPAPIFTTTDGVEVSLNSTVYKYSTTTGTPYMQTLFASTQTPYYSTREAAEKAYNAWLAEQPVLSLNDLSRFIDIGPYCELEELVKDKIAKR